ncbi:hypothetical protein D3C85_1389220 [compost metagenome]
MSLESFALLLAPMAQLIRSARSVVFAAPRREGVIAVFASLKFVSSVQEAKEGSQVFIVRLLACRNIYPWAPFSTMLPSG